MGRRVVKVAHAVGVMLAMLIASRAPLASQVRALNLREMVGAAGTIFVGTVTSARGGTDEHGDIVTYTTFNIEEPIYGVAARSVTIKQLGGEAGGITTRLEHMRYFQPGERVLVMLYPTSSLGFTSPIGLSQGAWVVTNNGLVAGISAESLSGLQGMLRTRGANLEGNGSIGRAAFVAVIGDLLKEVGKR